VPFGSEPDKKFGLQAPIRTVTFSSNISEAYQKFVCLRSHTRFAAHRVPWSYSAFVAQHRIALSSVQHPTICTPCVGLWASASNHQGMWLSGFTQRKTHLFVTYRCIRWSRHIDSWCFSQQSLVYRQIQEVALFDQSWDQIFCWAEHSEWLLFRYRWFDCWIYQEALSLLLTVRYVWNSLILNSTMIIKRMTNGQDRDGDSELKS
jgi:hypothetical protein